MSICDAEPLPQERLGRILRERDQVVEGHVNPAVCITHPIPTTLTTCSRATLILIEHATREILNNCEEDGWEFAAVPQGPRHRGRSEQP
jgi:phosphoribosyl-dephospho-CoA transferase